MRSQILCKAVRRALCGVAYNTKQQKEGWLWAQLALQDTE